MVNETEFRRMEIKASVIATSIVVVTLLGPSFAIWYFVESHSLSAAFSTLYWFLFYWVFFKKIGPWLQRTKAQILKDGGFSSEEIAEIQQDDPPFLR